MKRYNKTLQQTRKGGAPLSLTLAAQTPLNHRHGAHQMWHRTITLRKLRWHSIPHPALIAALARDVLHNKEKGVKIGIRRRRYKEERDV